MRKPKSKTFSHLWSLWQISCSKAHAAVKVHWNFVFFSDLTSYRIAYFLLFGAIFVKFLQTYILGGLTVPSSSVSAKKVTLIRTWTIIDSENNSHNKLCACGCILLLIALQHGTIFFYYYYFEIKRIIGSHRQKGLIFIL